MSDDALLTMLETVVDRLDLLEVQANMHSEAMIQIAEIALLAYAASGAEEPLPNALVTSSIIEEALCRHPERLKIIERSFPKAVRANLRIIESVLTRLDLSVDDRAKHYSQARAELMKRVARGEVIPLPKIMSDIPKPEPLVDRER